MSNLDEKIKAIMSKDIKTKTVLLSLDDVSKVVDEHIKEGWKVINSTEVNGKMKITFQMVK